MIFCIVFNVHFWKDFHVPVRTRFNSFVVYILKANKQSNVYKNQSKCKRNVIFYFPLILYFSLLNGWTWWESRRSAKRCEISSHYLSPTPERKTKLLSTSIETEQYPLTCPFTSGYLTWQHGEGAGRHINGQQFGQCIIHQIVLAACVLVILPYCSLPLLLTWASNVSFRGFSDFIKLCHCRRECQICWFGVGRGGGCRVWFVNM